ncbi:NADH-quinone oxidoreductase subunit L [Clostridium sp. YIM B02515]|uniref:NADH-quinone oxidoreductase subunit L n=1 Tax=Clostridium rhizosphaerae TaxID=2803861 RepID=A0ABS1T9F7_9CLOT|nr:proton-conducting transporter membrane subunit [Clostridium rhizosphaerae]MBL4935983.1 NADH-quinone oxidoreductase subunit L [Clostridium rhizosphaerae]
MNTLIISLLVVPIVFALLFLLNNGKTYFKALSYLLFAFGAIASITLAIHGPVQLIIEGSAFTMMEALITVLEILIIVFLFSVSMKHKRKGVFSLTFLQSILFIYTAFFMEKHHETVLNVDSFSIVMLLLVNIIGTLIVVFANGYITEYEHHRQMKSKQKLFYCVISIFIAAMNGLVMSDGLAWIYFFWEITTLASFILISYNGDAEAYQSGFRALFLNLIGGICFSAGNILFQSKYGITTLSDIANYGSKSYVLLVPVFLLCIAGFAKSAQMPFQSWLLGAMVAPTPVSALLHSSTMVKAGVYLIIKLSPAYAGTKLGTAIALYGGITFLLCSAIAVTQRNAKRILAYSTIANLGLIICSAGMGTSLGISAAIILIIFHAVSKALLFLCTGQIEHTIGSRDVEDMSGLIAKAPVLTLITAFGLVSMILPPFGVLITKLISIEAAAQNPFIVILLVLGSALTTLYYIKWMGTILSYPAVKFPNKETRDFNVYLPLWVLSILVLLSSIFVSPVYNKLVSPEIKSLLPKAPEALNISLANISTQLGSFNNNIVFIVIAFVILIALVVKGTLIGKPTRKNIYMCGENNTEDENLFRGPDGSYEKAVVSNYYLTRIFDEKLITRLGSLISVSLILIVILGGLA